jgi:hypothetical protein
MENMEPLGIGKCLRWVPGGLESYNWICKDCNKAKAIIRNEERLKRLKQEKQQQANWIKKRDKILKQNDK